MIVSPVSAYVARVHAYLLPHTKVPSKRPSACISTFNDGLNRICLKHVSNFIDFPLSQPVWIHWQCWHIVRPIFRGDDASHSHR